MNISFSRIWNTAISNRYWVACFLLVVVMTSFTLYGEYRSDFWEHSAVVKELATHPLFPQHPLFNLNKPHMFFSPYLLGVGLLARFGGMAPIDALAIAGVLNLLLLLLGLRLFIHCFFNKFQDAIAFYALILVLFLWPAEAWTWSGFIHFKYLGSVLPYPSTFAIGSTFLIFALYHHGLAHESNFQVLFTGLLSTVVFITHPPTAVVMFIGILAISLHFYNFIGFRALTIGLLLLIGTFSLAFLWPYYSLFDLITLGSNGQTNPQVITITTKPRQGASDMYARAYLIWPSLVLLPFALPSLRSRLRANKFDSFLLMLFATVLTYILGYFVGYFTGNYHLARTISFIAIFIQIALAARLAQLETMMRAGKFWPSLPVMLVFVIIVPSVALNSANKLALAQAFMGYQGLRSNYKDYDTLGRYVEQYDVVLADLKTSWKIPAFAGKIIASKHPVAFIDDHRARKNDQKTFFSKEAEAEEKFSVLKKYQVDYIFINKKRTEDVQTYYSFGNLVYETTDFLLIKTFQRKET